MTALALTGWPSQLVLSPRAWAMAAFALRAWVASMLALYIAYALQLESPYWAWLTVWLVAQPTPGMLLSKSLYLVLGTIGGAILGTTLIALFAQAPELFVLGLALAVAGCTIASNTLTNFRAYATVLSAYTAGLIASGAINNPDQVFFIAMARTSCILVGIACSVFVVSIFAPHRSAAETRKKLLLALQDGARRAVFSWQGNNQERLQIGRKLIFELIALNTLIEFAAAESANFRLQANRARAILSHLFSLVSARRSLDAHLERCGWPRHHALEIFHEVIIDFLSEMPAQLERGQVDELITGLGDVRRQLDLLQPEHDTVTSTELVSERYVIDRLDDLLTHLDGALQNWRDLLRGEPEPAPPVDLNFHRDLRAAWINGLRAFLAVCATGAFWIASAWDQGPLTLVFVSVLLSLFSAQPHPDRIGWAFFKSGLVAIIVGLIYKFYFLPMGSGFEYLAITMFFVLFPLGLLMSNPPTIPLAAAFSFVFTNVVRPFNPMVYDLSSTLNIAIAVEVGILFGTLSYILILPPDPRAARRYVTYRIRRGLGIVATMTPMPASACNWETRMYDRVVRLNDPQNPSANMSDEWLDAGLGALTLGNEILRLRRLQETEKLPAPLNLAITKIMTAFGCFLHRPQPATDEVRRQIIETAHLDPGPGQPGRDLWARVRGSFEEINLFLTRNPILSKVEATIW